MNIPFEATNGGENPVSGSSKVIINAFNPISKAEVFLSAAVGTIPSFVKVTEPQHVAALRGFDPKIGGRWVSQTFIAPEGQLLIIEGSKRKTFTDVGDCGRKIIRLREKAALREIKLKTMQLPVSSLSEVVVIKGRFDVLSLEEAKKYGYSAQAAHEDKYSQEECALVFSCSMLETEIESIEVSRVVKVAGTTGQHDYLIRTRIREV